MVAKYGWCLAWTRTANSNEPRAVSGAGASPCTNPCMDMVTATRHNPVSATVTPAHGARGKLLRAVNTGL